MGAVLNAVMAVLVAGAIGAILYHLFVEEDF